MILPSIKLVAIVVAAHSWYPPQCCGGNDCHPVPDGTVQELKDGVRVVGFGMLPYGDARLHWSEDDQDHVCSQGLRLFCVFRRPKEF